MLCNSPPSGPRESAPRAGAQLILLKFPVSVLQISSVNVTIYNNFTIYNQEQIPKQSYYPIRFFQTPKWVNNLLSNQRLFSLFQTFL